LCNREKEKKAEELQKEEAEAMQQRAELEDLLMERRAQEEKRKKTELGYGEISMMFDMGPPLPLLFSVNTL
jgi:hypothetical protein